MTVSVIEFFLFCSRIYDEVAVLYVAEVLWFYFMHFFVGKKRATEYCRESWLMRLIFILSRGGGTLGGSAWKMHVAVTDAAALVLLAASHDERGLLADYCACSQKIHDVRIPPNHDLCRCHAHF